MRDGDGRGAAPGRNRRQRPLTTVIATAAHALLRDSRACSGNFFIDDEVLAEEGITDLNRYAVQPGNPLFPDLFLDT